MLFLQNFVCVEAARACVAPDSPRSTERAFLSASSIQGSLSIAAQEKKTNNDNALLRWKKEYRD
jgi:hypothetical protein